MDKLFINFRTGDGEDKATWLDAELSAVFGTDRVFRSNRSIDLGHYYKPIMWGAVENCSALIAVIGDRWFTEFRDRLFDEKDVVRREIAIALAAGKPVIPVLGRGPMPKAEQLPPDLAALANRQYIRLTFEEQHSVPGLVERLISAVPELRIGSRHGIVDLATWDREQSSLLPEGLVLLGRGDEAEQVRSWLAGPPKNLVVAGQTTDEVASFACAVLNAHDRHHRAVLISSLEGWEHAAKIPFSFPAVVVSDGIPINRDQNARHVIIARSWNDDNRGAVVLPRLPRDEVRDAFLAQGDPLHRADEYAGLARRSTLALMRRLRQNGSRPPWAESADAAIATPLSLVSRWSMGNAADHEVIGLITGLPYSEVDRFVASSAMSEDPVVHRSGSRWQLTDPDDAWNQLMTKVTGTDIERFSEAALTVLGEVDPALSLPAREVPYAKVKGVSRTWSADLRQGLAHGLARLGDAGTARVGGEAAENHAARVVLALLRKAVQDRTGLLWRSLSDVLPLLAEAAPNIFLDAVSAGLQGTEPLLRVMFEDEEPQELHRHSAHTGLLWALETLAWSVEHQTMAAFLLAALGEIDPGGKLSNRPFASLASLLTHLPLGPIQLGRRAALVKQIQVQYQQTGWQLLKELTYPHPVLDYPVRPAVRNDWLAAEPAPSDTIDSYWEEVFGAALSALADQPFRWEEYLPTITSFPPSRREQFLSALENADLVGLDASERLALWNRARSVVHNERSVDGGLQRLSPEEVDRLASTARRIEPVADPTRHAWLFAGYLDLPGISVTDFEKHRNAAESLRREAVTAVLDQHGLSGLVRLAQASEVGRLVGSALAQVAGDVVQAEVLALLTEPLALGWVSRRSHDAGREWAKEVVVTLPEDPMKRAGFLLALPVEQALELLQAEDDRVREHFWSLTPAFPYPAEDPERYLVEVLAHDRAEAVIDALSMALHDPTESWTPSSELITAAFHALVKAPGQITGHTVYAIGRLLDHLTAHEETLSATASWEIRFATLFHGRQPRALLRVIAESPAAFVELHQSRFLPNGKMNPEALGFFITGHHMRCVPGQSGDRVDRSVLLNWVHRVRALLDEVGLLRSGDRVIGGMISACPAGEDGAWPAEAVRDVLEIAGADRLRDGFGIGLTNNQGISARGIYAGGQQERDAAAKYLGWAEAVEVRWPRTAGVLRSHARELHSLGKHWDQEAEDDHDE